MSGSHDAFRYSVPVEWSTDEVFVEPHYGTWEPIARPIICRVTSCFKRVDFELSLMES